MARRHRLVFKTSSPPLRATFHARADEESNLAGRIWSQTRSQISAQAPAARASRALPLSVPYASAFWDVPRSAHAAEVLRPVNCGGYRSRTDHELLARHLSAPADPPGVGPLVADSRAALVCGLRQGGRSRTCLTGFQGRELTASLHPAVVSSARLERAP
jgi:hypothetical protein